MKNYKPTHIIFTSIIIIVVIQLFLLEFTNMKVLPIGLIALSAITSFVLDFNVDDINNYYE